MHHRTRTRLSLASLFWLALCAWASPAAQDQRSYWIDALCGDDPVTRHLHDQLGAVARTRGWSTLPPVADCRWHGGRLSPAERLGAITRNAAAIGAELQTLPAGATVLVLTNSTVAARVADPKPLVLNPRAITRPLYLFSADEQALCSSGPLRVGYVRGAARPVEIREAIAYEARRPSSSTIDVREVIAISEFRNRLGDPGPAGLHVAAIVADDVGGAYEEFRKHVIAPSNGAVRPVSFCPPESSRGPAPVEPPKGVIERLNVGSVSYLRVVPAAGGTTKDASQFGFIRPGQDPEEVPPKAWYERWMESVFGTAQAATAEVKPSDFRDFPTLLAFGPASQSLYDDAQLKSVVSDCYFDGMFDALVGGLNPCRDRSNMLFGSFLLSAYADDAGSEEKGCALQAYYELMLTMPGGPGPQIAKNNIAILERRLKSCIGTSGALPRVPPAPGAPPAAAIVPCDPSPKERNEAQMYGPHYPYFRAALTAIAHALKASGPSRGQGLATAEDCLRTALSRSTVKRDCATFSQGLFVVPYEPALPYGIIRLKSGK